MALKKFVVNGKSATYVDMTPEEEAAHLASIPSAPPPEPTALEKLERLGLTLDDFKSLITAASAPGEKP